MNNNQKEQEGTPAPAVKQSVNTTLKVVTHNGVFHADEVFACAVITAVYPEANVVRTRDPEVISTADIVVDVGGIHDGKKERFDHHQKGGAGQRNDGTPYAAFGLVWAHYGHMFVKEISTRMGNGVKLTKHQCNQVVDMVDKSLVSSVDQADVDPQPGGGYSVSVVISAFNTTFLDTEGLPKDELTEALDKYFREVVSDYAVPVLSCAVRNAMSVVLAEAELDDAGAASKDGVVILDRFIPWQGIINDIWTCHDSKFVVFPTVDETWMCQVIPEEKGSFEPRMNLPLDWAGLRDSEFQELTGVGDAIFCHNGRFICGADSKDGAVALAKAATASAEAAKEAWSTITA